MTILAFFAGLILYFGITVLSRAWFVVKPNERAVLVTLGRAQRLGNQFVDDPSLNDDERKRYHYPLLRILGPGWHFKWPWQKPVVEDIATRSIDITWDPTKQQSTIEAVTKDNLTTGIDGQLRWRVAQSNFYAYSFGVDSPLEHVMGYFVSVLRERVANFVDPKGQSLVDGGELAEGGAAELAVELSEGVSINDLRKNLPLLNDYMEQQCKATGARYGIELDAALITQIDPPPAVDRALSAINSTRNQVAADISTARADAEQQITMSKRAVEIARNNAQAEVAPLRELANTLKGIKAQGSSKALAAYIRNMRIPLLGRARRIVQMTATTSAAAPTTDGGRHAQ